jgi:hypothetical protein
MLEKVSCFEAASKAGPSLVPGVLWAGILNVVITINKWPKTAAKTTRSNALSLFFWREYMDRGWKTVFEHSGKLFGKGFLLPVSLQCSNSSGMHAH